MSCTSLWALRWVDVASWVGGGSQLKQGETSNTQYGGVLPSWHQRLFVASRLSHPNSHCLRAPGARWPPSSTLNSSCEGVMAPTAIATGASPVSSFLPPIRIRSEERSFTNDGNWYHLAFSLTHLLCSLRDGVAFSSSVALSNSCTTV